MNKTVVRIAGGLGNQMFQYAFARALSKNSKIFLDLDFFKSTDFRKYLLNRYKIKNYTDADSRFKSLLKQEKRSFFGVPRKYLDYDKIFEYRSEVFEIKGDVYYSGYWQSENYFNNIRKKLLDEFELKQQPSGLNMDILSRINNTDAIMVHIRRGDYLTNPNHFALDVEYYVKAIEMISRNVTNPHFFVFSDDPVWTRNNIKIPDFPTEYIDHNTKEDAVEDLRLMNACKHFIIANSSFSWWGAWLSKNEDKIVIAPKQWFPPDVKLNTKDLIPDAWIKI